MDLLGVEPRLPECKSSVLAIGLQARKTKMSM